MIQACNKMSNDFEAFTMMSFRVPTFLVCGYIQNKVKIYTKNNIIVLKIEQMNEERFKETRIIVIGAYNVAKVMHFLSISVSQIIVLPL